MERILLFAAEIKAYAGFWSEWGNRNDTPVEAGLAAIMLNLRDFLVGPNSFGQMCE
ncbi:MAG: hypothetical protein M0Z99_09425 [Betaproteobacteria bacterium]|nr:hypothetical protein [Betaproteobacteria bacterium]